MEIKNPYEFWASHGVGCIPIKEKSKNPLDNFEWGGYTDAPASSETRERWAKMKGNHAVIAGRRLIILDWENEIDIFSIFKKFDAFCKAQYVVKTGKGYHVYFFSDWNEPYAQIKKDGKVICEVRTGVHYVVGAGCTHPTGKKYELIGNDTPEHISKRGFEEMKAKISSLGFEYKMAGDEVNVENPSVGVEEILAHRKRDKKLDDLLNGSIEGYPSRSEAELALVCKLLFYNATKEQVWEIMNSGKIGKWKEKSESYRHLTYNRAVQFLSQKVWSLEELDKNAFAQNAQNASGANSTDVKRENAQKCPNDGLGQIGGLCPAPIVGAGKVFPLPFVAYPLGKIPENLLTPPGWYIDNEIPIGGKVFLGAPVAAGKSTFAAYTISRIASGAPNWDGTKPTPTRVLFCDEEDSMGHIYQMFSQIRMKLNPEEQALLDENLFVSSGQGINVGEFERFLTLVRLIKPSVIVIDSFRKLAVGDENESTEINKIDSDFLNPIMAEFPGLTWILIHHNSKRNRNDGRTPENIESMRGSSAIGGLATVVIMLEKLKGDNLAFYVSKNKWGRSYGRLLTIERENGLSIGGGAELEVGLAEAAKLAERIVGWILKVGKFEGITTKSIKEEFGEGGTLDSALRILKDRGALIGRGKDNRSPFKFIPDGARLQDVQVVQDVQKSKQLGLVAGVSNAQNI